MGKIIGYIIVISFMMITTGVTAYSIYNIGWYYVGGLLVALACVALFLFGVYLIARK